MSNEIKERQLHQILNPYQLDQSEMARTQIWVSYPDKMLLNSVYPVRGVESLLLSGIYKRICEQLRQENITSYTPSNARRAHEIILSYITPLPIGGTRPVEDVTGGTDQVSQPCENTSDQSANIRKTTPRGQRNGGSKRGNRKETKSDAS